MITRLLQLTTRQLALVLVLLPFALYALYVGLFAADRYVSESVISVRQAGGDAGSLPGAALLLAGITPAAQEDTLHLKDFVLSQGLLDRLEQRLKLRQHFGEAGADFPYRLRTGASKEDFTRYYRSRVEVSYDDRSALLKLRTQGFDANFAQQLNRAILEESERFVNESSHGIARDRMRFAEGELARAAERLKKARDELLTFQAKHRLLDPVAEAAGTGQLAVQLQAQRARVEAELNGLRTFLKEDAFQVQNLKAQLTALDRQISAERERATTASSQGERLNTLVAEFRSLELTVHFAQDAYKLALAAVENARIDATRKIKSLAIIEPPTLPETAEYPLKAYNLLTLAIISLLLFAIMRLVLAIVREHHD